MGKAIEYTEQELKWIKQQIKANAQIKDIHAQFCQQFNHPRYNIQTLYSLLRRNRWTKKDHRMAAHRDDDNRNAALINILSDKEREAMRDTDIFHRRNAKATISTPHESLTELGKLLNQMAANGEINRKRNHNNQYAYWRKLTVPTLTN